MSKMRRRPKIGLALGGGGARGIAHIGVLKVLEIECWVLGTGDWFDAFDVYFKTLAGYGSSKTSFSNISKIELLPCILCFD